MAFVAIRSDGGEGGPLNVLAAASGQIDDEYFSGSDRHDYMAQELEIAALRLRRLSGEPNAKLQLRALELITPEGHE